MNKWLSYAEIDDLGAVLEESIRCEAGPLLQQAREANRLRAGLKEMLYLAIARERHYQRVAAEIENRNTYDFGLMSGYTVSYRNLAEDIRKLLEGEK